MFVNLATGEAAHLIEHDNHSVVFTGTEGGRDVELLPDSDFFATHREATREEIEAGAPAKVKAPKNGDAPKLAGKDSGRQERHTRDE